MKGPLAQAAASSIDPYGEEDGTPLVQVTDETFDAIYEHRNKAKDRSVTSVTDANPLLNSSFLGLDSGQSELLYSKSSERDRINLE